MRSKLAFEDADAALRVLLKEADGRLLQMLPRLSAKLLTTLRAKDRAMKRVLLLDTSAELWEQAQRAAELPAQQQQQQQRRQGKQQGEQLQQGIVELRTHAVAEEEPLQGESMCGDDDESVGCVQKGCGVVRALQGRRVVPVGVEEPLLGRHEAEAENR